jgi:FkbM family methyltransferase
LAFSRFVGPEGRVVTVEPHPQILPILRSNLERAELTNCELVASAAGATRGSAAISIFSNSARINSGSGALHTRDQATPAAFEVPVIPLDGLGLKSCSLIKVDVEGREADAVTGLLKTIERCKPFLYLELTESSLWQQLMAIRDWSGWSFYFVSTRAYNRRNIRSNPRNFFGFAREAALLLAPPGWSHDKLLSQDLDVFTVESEEELHLALTNMPRFGQESTAEIEQERLGARVAELELVIADLRFRDLAARMAPDKFAEETLREIYRSRSWRLTKPLRLITRVLRRVRRSH